MEEQILYKKEGLFCLKCNNLLSLLVKPNNIVFKCEACNTMYKSNDEDTLIYQYIKYDNIDKYERYFKNLTKDPINPKVSINCPKCKHNLGSSMRLNTNLSIVTICDKCLTKI